MNTSPLYIHVFMDCVLDKLHETPAGKSVAESLRPLDDAHHQALIEAFHAVVADWQADLERIRAAGERKRAEQQEEASRPF